MESTTHPNAHYTVVLMDGTRIDALPTPALLEAVGRGYPEAYQESEATEQYPPIWRLRDDKYDLISTTYVKVRTIVRKVW